MFPKHINSSHLPDVSLRAAIAVATTTLHVVLDNDYNEPSMPASYQLVSIQVVLNLLESPSFLELIEHAS